MARRYKGFVLGTLIALAGVVTTLLPVGAGLEEDVGLYWLFRLRGAIAPPPDVVIVAIDQHSARKLGLPNKPSEWPRSLHARLLRQIASAQPRVVAFDLAFDSSSRLPVDDQQFAEAISEAGNVVLVASLKREILGNNAIDWQVPPVPVLERAALAHAPFPLPKSSRVNSYWAFTPGAAESPTLPALAFQIYALQVYDDFFHLWEKAAGPPAILPPAGDGAASPDDVEGLTAP